MSKDMKLSPDLIEKLKGFSVVSDTIDYRIDIKDVPTEFHPVFKIKNLTKIESMEISKMMRKFTKNKDDDNEIDKMNAELDDVTRSKIYGWENLYDLSTGEPFQFEGEDDGSVKKELYDKLPEGIRAKVLSHIYKLSGVLS